MEHKVKKAIELARKYHLGQKYGNKDYFYHLEQVANLSRSIYEIDEIEIVAYLHDTVEDTALTLDEIRAEFGDYIANNVWVCTDERGRNRKERKRSTYKKLAEARKNLCLHLGIAVKVSDRLANVIECSKTSPSLLNMYRGEQEEFRNSAFVSGMCDNYWEKLGRLLK